MQSTSLAESEALDGTIEVKPEDGPESSRAGHELDWIAGRAEEFYDELTGKARDI